jgi:hypothetical protein
VVAQLSNSAGENKQKYMFYCEGCKGNHMVIEGWTSPFKCGVCHSHVTDGKIQYLSDCTHELTGQTIEVEEPEPEDRSYI